MSSKVALLGAAGVAVGALWFAYRQRQEATATPADSAAAAEDSAAAPTDDAPDAKAAEAAATIKGWAACMRSRLKTAGKGTQNAEMLLVSKVRVALALMLGSRSLSFPESEPAAISQD